MNFPLVPALIPFREIRAVPNSPHLPAQRRYPRRLVLRSHPSNRGERMHSRTVLSDFLRTLISAKEPKGLFLLLLAYHVSCAEALGM